MNKDYNWNLLIRTFIDSKAKRLDFNCNGKDASIYWVVSVIRIDIKSMAKCDGGVITR
jgi:hypothetical protein